MKTYKKIGIVALITFAIAGVLPFVIEGYSMEAWNRGGANLLPSYARFVLQYGSAMIFGFIASGIALVIASVKYYKSGIQNVADTSPQAPPPPSNICPTCHHPLTYIEEHKAWYCFNCKEYR
jgi:hypothetical protein